MIRDLQQEYRDPKRPWGFVGHQANLRMLERVCDACEIAPEHHFHNLVDFGNTAAAGSPSVLSQRWDSWGASNDVAVAGVGAGLTWSSYLLRFRS
jgi:3-oxoacyl-[acyl-carrier-protein] synthase-3